MNGDKPLISLLTGRLGAAVTAAASVLLLVFGVDVSPEDQAAAVAAGTEAINAGSVLAAKITAGIAVIQTLVSKYKPRA